ncbi:medium chain dehydrogenase/reductase family protein [Algiphilus sp.]|uniref:medium chain dehydrogenase/reductase family protein n=1 Tax=Algiphilus sp. TaxID=1872431 RepID=UPI003B52FE20
MDHPHHASAAPVSCKHVQALRRGGPERLQVQDVTVAPPGTGEIRVRMLAAGVAFADLMIREGVYPIQLPWPRTPGYDIVGEIDAVGPDVPDTWQPGMRVAALTVHGSYAEYRLLPAAQCVAVPEHVDPAQAVALVLNYLTAWQMLFQVAHLERGHTVLIHAAAGGVGTAVLELGRHFGLQVIGLCSAAKHDRVRSLGGIPIDYRHEQVSERVSALTEGRGVDAVLDAVGGRETRRSWQLLAPTGTLVCYGALSVASKGRVRLHTALPAVLGAARFSALRLFSEVKAVAGYNVDVWRRHRPEAYRSDLARLVDLLAEGVLDPVIADRLPLAEAAVAQERLGAGRSEGKLVLI